MLYYNMKRATHTGQNVASKTSIKRAVTCPNCKWLFTTNKDEPQCSQCGL